MKLCSWNVNGLRAGIKKGTFLKFIDSEKPDILCIQETKMQPGQATIDLPDYQEFWNSATRPGYSGTAVFSKVTPLSVSTNFSKETLEHFDFCADTFGHVCDEGRILTLEFPKFYLINVYVPNSKRSLERLSLRQDLWDPALLFEAKLLEQKKPVVICGDFNVAATAIDLARPRDNEHNAGYTIEERTGIKNLLDAGLVDTFRTLHPDEVKYTWWSNFGHARIRNIGWRIDYFLISENLKTHLRSAEIYDDVMGSDHCPVSIEMEV